MSTQNYMGGELEVVINHVIESPKITEKRLSPHCHHLDRTFGSSLTFCMCLVGPHVPRARMTVDARTISSTSTCYSSLRARLDRRVGVVGFPGPPVDSKRQGRTRIGGRTQRRRQKERRMAVVSHYVLYVVVVSSRVSEPLSCTGERFWRWRRPDPIKQPSGASGRKAAIQCTGFRGSPPTATRSFCSG